MYALPTCNSYYYPNLLNPYQLPIPYQTTFATGNDQRSNEPLSELKENSHATTSLQLPHYSSPYGETRPIYPENHTIHDAQRLQWCMMGNYLYLAELPTVHPTLAVSTGVHTDSHQSAKRRRSLNDYFVILNNQSANISIEELDDLLTGLTYQLGNSFINTREQQRFFILIDLLDALISIRASVLVSVSHNPLFILLQKSLIDVLDQWCRLSYISMDELFMFRTMSKLLNILINNTDDVNLLPSWLSDSSLLETIADCLTNIATSPKLLDHTNKRQFKQFTRLFDVYIIYQQLLDEQHPPNTDTLLPLLDPVLQCLTSSHFVTSFTNMQTHVPSLTTSDNFFLLKCSTFLISYNGSRLEQTMESLLSTMLPQYVIILDKLTVSVSSWTSSTIRSVRHLLEMVNHGASRFSTNAKLVGTHLAMIDHVLRLLDEPLFYENVGASLSGDEMLFVNTAVSFLVNMINEPSVLAHVKQRRVAPVFLRLTSCEYEPLVLNLYILVAYTTHEEDIKAMQNPGRLLSTIVKSLKRILNEAPEKNTSIEQLLETLKGLVQHDQIKDEIIKQDALPFLIECSNQFTGRALVLIFEILWCLTFFEEIASTLRANPSFIEKIETASKNTNDGALKKALDGLVWKLIQEAAFLEKVARQKEEKVEVDEIDTSTELVVGADGKKKVVEKTKRVSVTTNERSYRYDIMLSYCHADKELTYKIQKFLVGHGFKVWIDLDNMYGPAMSAMADAVENSEFVLMCMSDAYKQSTYCQAEAEYAFKCKRRLIPLVMRQGYKPDGWLGFMIGSRMYVDFGRHDFEIACEKLMTEITLQRKQQIPALLIDSILRHKSDKSVPPTSKHSEEKKKKSSRQDIVSSVLKAQLTRMDFIRKPIVQWTESDTSTFLSTYRLNPMIPLCEELDGRALLELYHMCRSHRLHAYTILKHELKSLHDMKLSIGTYSRFLSVVEDLITSQAEASQRSTTRLPMTTSSVPFLPAQHSNMPYDFIITSDASPLDTLKMVQNFSSQLQYLDSVRRHGTNKFQ